MTDTDTANYWIDEKGRKRRGVKPAATDSSSSFQVEAVEDTGPEPSPKPPSKPKSKTKSATKPTTKKETKVSPESTRGRQAGVSYSAPTITGTADEAPAGARRPSIYAPIIEQVIKNNAKAKNKWTLINPEGRKATSFRSAITQAAGKMTPPVKLETAQGDVDGTEMVYVRVKA